MNIASEFDQCQLKRCARYKTEIMKKNVCFMLLLCNLVIKEFLKKIDLVLFSEDTAYQFLAPLV